MCINQNYVLHYLVCTALLVRFVCRFLYYYFLSFFVYWWRVFQCASWNYVTGCWFVFFLSLSFSHFLFLVQFLEFLTNWLNNPMKLGESALKNSPFLFISILFCFWKKWIFTWEFYCGLKLRQIFKKSRFTWETEWNEPIKRIWGEKLRFYKSCYYFKKQTW